MQTPMTTQKIDQALASLDLTLTELEIKAASLSLAATEGDADAVAALAGVRSEIELTRGDRTILASARRAAQDRAKAQDAAAQAEARTRHLADARASAAMLLACAGRIDALVADFQTAIADLAVEQASLRASVRAAGDALLDTRVGRASSENHAAFLMSRAVDRSAAGRNDKSMQDLISVAWAEYLEKEHANV
jgi:hypothetical protein